MLILKPDGIKTRIQNRILKLAASEDIRVHQRKLIELDKQLLESLYPQFRPDAHPVSFALLSEYMLNRTAELWLLKGANAVRSARKIRWAIRKTYSRNNFKNLIHAPEYEAEARWQVAICFPSVGTVSDIKGRELEPVQPSPWVPRDPRLLSAQALRRVITQVWKSSNLPEPVMLEPDSCGDHYVLMGDDQNTVDVRACALLETISAMTFDSAVYFGFMAIATRFRGRVCVARGGIRPVGRVVTQLTARGINAKVKRMAG